MILSKTNLVLFKHKISDTDACSQKNTNNVTIITCLVFISWKSSIVKTFSKDPKSKQGHCNFPWHFFFLMERQVFLHVNLCILIKIEEQDKNVNGFILKIKEFQKKIANIVNYSLWCGFGERDHRLGGELPTLRRDILQSLERFCSVW